MEKNKGKTDRYSGFFMGAFTGFILWIYLSWPSLTNYQAEVYPGLSFIFMLVVLLPWLLFTGIIGQILSSARLFKSRSKKS